MISWDRREGESLIIEDDMNGLRYRIEVVKVEEGQSAQLAVEVMGPDCIENNKSLYVQNDGRPIQLRLE